MADPVIALVGNPSNFATSLAPELRKRGDRVFVFGPRNVLLDQPDVVINPQGGLVRKLLNRVRVGTLKRRPYDLVLNYSNRMTGFNGPTIMYWQGAELFWGADEYLGRKADRKGFYCTPDIARFLSDDSVLLPRACSVNRFFKIAKSPTHDRRIIRIGHFWRRLGLDQSYYNRYWKKTDILLEAIDRLQKDNITVKLIEGPVPRKDMPEALASLDVYVDEFCNLSHSMTAIEALLVGTPVVGTYDPRLCECKEALDQMINVPSSQWYGPDPNMVKTAILEAAEARVSPSEAVYKYYHPAHAADILEQTLKRHMIDHWLH